MYSVDCSFIQRPAYLVSTITIISPHPISVPRDYYYPCNLRNCFSAHIIYPDHNFVIIDGYTEPGNAQQRYVTMAILIAMVSSYYMDTLMTPV